MMKAWARRILIPDDNNLVDVKESPQSLTGHIELEEGFVDHEDAFEDIEETAAPVAQIHKDIDEESDKT